MENNRWDKKYREGFYDGIMEPHDLLKRFYHLIPHGGNVIDIAMGNGRDALYLAEKGFNVYGLESSKEAIKIVLQSKHRHLNIIMADAKALPIKTSSMDGVVVFYFLLRQTSQEIVSLLRRGGIVIYETFLKRQNEIDRKRNPSYLLDDGELLSLFPLLELIFYEETISFVNNRKRATARLVGRKR